MLRCPKCKEPLIKVERSYQCSNHHSYDIAKRGYSNLSLSNHAQSGDDKGMVRARSIFLEHGYYHVLQEALLKICIKLNADVIVDAGCGQGYYTNAIAKTTASEVYGFDLSKHAVDEACKAHAGVMYGVANIFHMPIADACAHIALSIFAPFDEGEIARVLKEDGYFIKVSPGPKHLMEMKQVLYQDVYENEEPAKCDSFILVEELLVEDEIEVIGADDIKALFQMTPYYWKSPKESSEKLLSMEHLTTNIQFRVQRYRKENHHE